MKKSIDKFSFVTNTHMQSTADDKQKDILVAVFNNEALENQSLLHPLTYPKVMNILTNKLHSNMPQEERDEYTKAKKALEEAYKQDSDKSLDDMYYPI